MAGILDWITEKAKAQYAKGAPYREAVGGLLQGDMNKVNQALSKSDLTPMDFATTFAPIGITAWHGSPAKFDVIDMSKLKSGTGVNAYGPGFYSSEAPSIAVDYQKKLSGWTPGTQSLLKRMGGNIDSAIEEANRSLDFYKKSVSEGGHGDLRRAESMLEIQQNKLNDLLNMKAGVTENKGYLYKLDIADEALPKMLDWDKYISEQPYAMEKLKSSGIIDEGFMKAYGGKGGEGENVWKAAISKYGSQEKAADELKKLGIPGIKYLDKGQDNGLNVTAQNYSVFDPNIIKILERNGLLLP